jgi:protein tyrosine phosphatase
MANTIVDFYQMIWQEYVPVIVMITRLIEKNKSKCERYIPETQDGQYGPFSIQVKSITYKNDYEIRRLIIEVKRRSYD